MKYVKEKEKIEYYSKIKSNKIGVFENISNKNELFDFFVAVNYEIFQKPYLLESTFSNFLKVNEELIKQNFGENIKYNEILEKKNIQEIENKKEELFNTIKKDMDIDKLFIIIASFYYLLFYQFKDVKVIKGRTNIGNVYINTILSKFVKFLSVRVENLNINLTDLLNEIYLFDLEDAKYKETEKKEISKTIYFNDIEKRISSCGSNLKTKFELDKEQYKDEISKNFGILENLAQRVYEESVFNYYCLKGKDKEVYSNTLTFIVDILSKEEDKENEWTNFLKYFDKKSIFYFYKWSYFDKKNLLTSKKEEIKCDAKNLSKICGILLADILISNKFLFNNFQINLVGFNLGANVVKYCLKELSKLNGKNNFVKFKNIILIGAATHIKHEDKWREIIKNNVISNFINCYSGSDENLKSFYSICSKNVNKNHKPPIGINSLELKDENGINLVKNFDFTENKFDQLSYNFEKVAEKISQDL